jgi:hypothetical protein
LVVRGAALASIPDLGWNSKQTASHEPMDFWRSARRFFGGARPAPHELRSFARILGGGIDPEGPMKTLGILQLENTPLTYPGCMGNPASFRYPVLYRTVPGAWVADVVPGDASLLGVFERTARELVAEGVSAITTNCGFTVRFQKQLAAAVAVPVSASSLLLLPTLLASLTPGGRIGVLTFDSRSFTRDVFAAAGVPADAPIVVAGIEGSRSYDVMSEPVVDLPIEQLRHDVLARAERLLAEKKGISRLLLECVGFCPVAPLLRSRTGLPVLDAISNADLLMAGLGAPA